MSAGKYFGDRYLARDFYGNVAITLTFICIAGLVYPDGIGKSLLEFLGIFQGGFQSAVLSIGCAIVLATTGHFSGVLYMAVQNLVRKVDWVYNNTAYEKYYNPACKDITLLFQSYIVEGSDLRIGAKKPKRLGDMIGQLLMLFEREYPEGYVAVYRSYMFVSMLRSGVVYLLALLVYDVLYNSGQYLYQITGSIVVVYLSISHAIRYAVGFEYDYLIIMANNCRKNVIGDNHDRYTSRCFRYKCRLPQSRMAKRNSP